VGIHHQLGLRPFLQEVPHRHGTAPASVDLIQLSVAGLCEWEEYMKLIAAAIAALFLAVLSLSVPAPIFTTEASANRMDGKPTCGNMICPRESYYAAKRREAKTKKSK
jgi:hypothetical protein